MAKSPTSNFNGIFTQQATGVFKGQSWGDLDHPAVRYFSGCRSGTFVFAGSPASATDCG